MSKLMPGYSTLHACFSFQQAFALLIMES